MAKHVTPVRVSEFGVTAELDQNTTTLSVEWGGRPVDYCLVQAQRLRAMTLLITGEGFETFSDLNKRDQHHIIEVMDDLASRVVMLSKLAEKAEDERDIREAANG
ncbi:hypothetical protein GCM10027093_21370 [Paraburkholderia jirisanensis]